GEGARKLPPRASLRRESSANAAGSAPRERRERDAGAEREPSRGVGVQLRLRVEARLHHVPLGVTVHLALVRRLLDRTVAVAEEAAVLLLLVEHRRLHQLVREAGEERAERRHHAVLTADGHVAR